MLSLAFPTLALATATLAAEQLAFSFDTLPVETCSVQLITNSTHQLILARVRPSRIRTARGLLGRLSFLLDDDSLDAWLHLDTAHRYLLSAEDETTSADSFDAASAFAPVPFLSSHQSTNGLAQAAMMRQSPRQPTRFSSWMAPVETYMDSESEGTECAVSVTAVTHPLVLAPLQLNRDVPLPDASTSRMDRRQIQSSPSDQLAPPASTTGAAQQTLLPSCLSPNSPYGGYAQFFPCRAASSSAPSLRASFGAGALAGLSVFIWGLVGL